MNTSLASAAVLFILALCSPVTAQLRITEIMCDPSDAGGMPDAGYEFVELQNTGAVTVNLQNWTIASMDRGPVVLTASFFSVAPGAVVVVGNAGLGAFNAAYNTSLTPQQYISMAGSLGPLRNTGDRIILRDGSGVNQWEQLYRSGTFAWPVNPEGTSLIFTRAAASAGPEILADGGYWANQPPPPDDASGIPNDGGGWASPGSVPQIAPGVTDGVRFTELMVTPAAVPGTPPPGIEFVEIYNRSAAVVNLQNWSIALDNGSQQPLTPFSFTLPPGGYLVLGNVPVTTFNAVYNVSLPPSGYLNMAGALPELPDPAGELYLRDGSDLVRARIRYTNNGNGWPAFGTGGSLTLGVPPASAALAQFENGTSWGVQAPPWVDASSVLTDAGGYASPGAGFLSAGTAVEWDGGAGADNRWSSPANWAGDAVPPAGAAVAFRQGLTAAGVDLDGDRTVAAVVCEAGLDFPIGGGTLTLTGGGMSIRMPYHAVTVNAPLVFTGPDAVVDANQYTQLFLQANVTGQGNLTWTGRGTFHMGANTGCAAKFSFLSGTLNMLGRVIAARDMALSGEALNGPGDLKCTGNVQHSGFVSVSGGPALYMLPTEVDMITTIAGVPLNGLSLFVKNGPGTTYLQTQVNAADFDLAGGALDLYGDSTVRVSHSARLRAGTTLYDIAGSGGALLLRGNAQLINEGAEMFSEPSIGVSNALNETVTISGAPLTGLGWVVMAGGNQGQLMLATDVTAQRLQLIGKVNLNDHTLTSTQPGWAVAFGGALIDSGSAGTLRIAGDFQNNGATFLSEPTLAMRPANASSIINVQGSTINDLGALRVENAGSVVLKTFVNTRDFDLAGGSCDLYGDSFLRVSGTAWLRAGATLYDIAGSGGTLLLRGNARLIYEGAELLYNPSLGISNGPGQNVRLSGSIPLTGLGSLTMAGTNQGAVTLDGMDVTARRLILIGTVDLNGQTLTSTQAGGVTELTGKLADSGTGGTLRLSSSFQNNNAEYISEPSLAMHPAAAEHVLTIQGNNIEGLGALLVENTGKVNLLSRVGTRDFDLSGGKLQLNAPELIVTGQARLRAGTVLTGPPDFSAVGDFTLRGNAVFINEGVTIGPALAMSLRPGGTDFIRLTGTAPLSGLEWLIIMGYDDSVIQFDGLDTSAKQIAIGTPGTLDLRGSTLTSSDPAWKVILYGRIMDTATGGTLQVAGSVESRNATFISDPSLKLTPGFFQFTSLFGTPIFGLGRLTVAGDPVGMVTAGTNISMKELDIAGGTFSLNNTSSTAVTERVWLREGTALFSGGPLGALGLFDNCRVENYGALMDLKPGFFAFNSTGQTISFHGPAPITDAGSIFKYGTGTLALHTPFAGEFCQLEAGTLDLCGGVHAFRGSPGGIAPESLSTAAGSVVRDSAGGGGLVLRHGLRNKGATFADAPDITFDPPVFASATLVGQPVLGLGRLALSTPGTLMQFATASAAGLEIYAGDWRPHGAGLSVSGGVLLTGAGAIDRNFVSQDGSLEVSGGDLDGDSFGSVINVADLRISHAAGACRVLRNCEVNALRVIKSGASTLDLNGHTLFTHESFTLERGLLRDQSAGGGGRIQFLYPAPMTTRFTLQEGDVDVPVTGHPYWNKETAATAILRGYLENSGDIFYTTAGALHLDLDNAETLKAASLTLAPSTTLTGRGRITDGPVFASQSSRIRPDAQPGALNISGLILGSESMLELPLLAGAAPLTVPAAGSLTLPPLSPSACVLVKVTGNPVAGTAYNLFTWAGALTPAQPQLSQFQLHNSPPGYLQFNAAGDSLQFIATATGGWDAWRTENFTAAELADNSISGPAADPDSDGLDNLAEYTLGALPKSADSADRFSTEDTMVNGIPALAIRFAASRTATDVFIESETAVSLTDWQPASLDATGHKTDSTIEYVAWIPRDGGRRQLRVMFRRPFP